MDIAISRTTPCAPIFEVARDGEAEAEAERLPMTTRRIRGARKGAGWISGVRLRQNTPLQGVLRRRQKLEPRRAHHRPRRGWPRRARHALHCHQPEQEKRSRA